MLNRPWLEQEHRCERLVEYAWVLQHLRPGRILDYGYASSYLAEGLCAFGTVLGVDPRRTPHITHPRFHHQPHLTSKDQGFDTIVCVSVLEHYLPFRETVLDLRSRLSPNGILLVTIPTGRPRPFKGYRVIGEEELQGFGGTIHYFTRCQGGWWERTAVCPEAFDSTQYQVNAIACLAIPAHPAAQSTGS